MRGLKNTEVIIGDARFVAPQTLRVGDRTSVRLSEQALAEAPLSGALFALKMPGVRGLPETTFAG